MGMLLDSAGPASLYQEVVRSPYFVDKTAMLAELIPMLESNTKYICVTRPRRFGKTVIANMIGAFFSKGADSGELFDGLRIADYAGCQAYRNQYHVIYIDFSVSDDECDSYRAYIGNIKTLLREDLRRAYPQISFREEGNAAEDLRRIYSETGEKFLFVLDEWDAVFHMPFVREADKVSYLAFLKGLLKGGAYVALAYMTGVLPIAKYSSGSELNMFAEFTMANSPAFGEYFGFTGQEVDDLYGRYCRVCTDRKVSREGLRLWYNGYHTAAGDQVYNPRSVVFALQFNNLGSYWTSSGPYDEIFYYIKNNIADIREDLALLVSGEPVQARIQEYAATAMELKTRDQIFSAMVVYGFLSVDGGKVVIPNKELMDKFDDVLRNEASLGYIYRLARQSDKMLRATLARDTETMAEILEFAHNTEAPLLYYHHETELSAIINLVYLSARDRYRVEREDKAGVGYVDFIFYPYNRNEDGIILELKVDHTPEEAIRQIKQKQYMLRFAGRLGERQALAGRVLAVGIGYSKKEKKHGCVVEVLKD